MSRRTQNRIKGDTFNPLLCYTRSKGTIHVNAELMRKFYTSFANRDVRGMAACYHPAVKFSDEVSPNSKEHERPLTSG